jgi:hypothetical protein
MANMKKFISSYRSIIAESTDDWNVILKEALITFKGKQYPNFGQIVIVAGGPASGKGFVIDNLFGISGKRYDVDSLKEDIKRNAVLRKSMAAKYNVNESVFDMATPEDVSVVHQIIRGSKLKKEYENSFFIAARNASEELKPNLIFDKTCSSIKDVYEIVGNAIFSGYKPENIHLVWVLNDVETARRQNAERDRHVDESLLNSLHKEVANTMKTLFEHIREGQIELDGDIYIAFNKRGEDVTSKKLKSGNNHFIEDANYFKIKSAGSNNIDIPASMNEKIQTYTPERSW